MTNLMFFMSFYIGAGIANLVPNAGWKKQTKVDLLCSPTKIAILWEHNFHEKCSICHGKKSDARFVVKSSQIKHEHVFNGNKDFLHTQCTVFMYINNILIHVHTCYTIFIYIISFFHFYIFNIHQEHFYTCLIFLIHD